MENGEKTMGSLLKLRLLSVFTLMIFVATGSLGFSTVSAEETDTTPVSYVFEMQNLYKTYADDNRTAEDLAKYIYSILPRIAREGTREADFVEMQYILIHRYVNSEMVADPKWGFTIDRLKDLRFGEVVKKLPQYQSRYQGRTAIDTLEQLFDGLPEIFKAHYNEVGMTNEIHSWITDSWRYLEVASITSEQRENTKWETVNEAFRARYRTTLKDMKDSEASWYTKYRAWETLNPVIKRVIELCMSPQELGEAMDIAGPFPVAAVRATAEQVSSSQLVTISLNGSNHLSGYLVRDKTLGRDPDVYIGFRPGGAPLGAIFSGVFVFKQSEIEEVVYFDDAAGIIVKMSLEDYLNEFMIISEQ